MAGIVRDVSTALDMTGQGWKKGKSGFHTTEDLARSFASAQDDMFELGERVRENFGYVFRFRG